MDFPITKPAKAAAFALTAFLLCSPAVAEDGPCDGFSWPMATELAWMQAADAVAVKSGGEIAALPAKAVALALPLTKDAALPTKSGIKEGALAPDSYSGFLTIKALPKKAVYQVTLSKHAWIDVVQGDKSAETVAFTGRGECPIVRKSVRFELGEGPVTLMVVGSDVETVKIAIREAQD
ncbi:hypothetical protein Rvan_3471 [Rhodomicrobium vannielii ATCC 17100]|uniref:Invasion associated locus B family protein n=2 Tax=Rhodomicrobium vannielii TaxID=1069 RepID=E3I402_RHOVT|nr:hypothetical protein Rvan_3471 [Rhodomicrobium vannielii ATCC 17100]